MNILCLENSKEINNFGWIEEILYSVERFKKIYQYVNDGKY